MVEKNNNEIVKAINKLRVDVQCLTTVETVVKDTLVEVAGSMANSEVSLNQMLTTVKRGFDGIEDCLQGMIDHSDYLIDGVTKGQFDLNKADIEEVRALLQAELTTVKGGNEPLSSIRDFINDLYTGKIEPLGLVDDYKTGYVEGTNCTIDKIDSLKQEMQEQLEEASARTEDPNNIYSQYLELVTQEAMTENGAVTALDLELADIQAIRVHVDEVENLLIQIREILRDIYARLGVTNNLISTLIDRTETTNSKLDTLILLTQQTHALLDNWDQGAEILP